MNRILFNVEPILLLTASNVIDTVRSHKLHVGRRGTHCSRGAASVPEQEGEWHQRPICTFWTPRLTRPSEWAWRATGGGLQPREEMDPQTGNHRPSRAKRKGLVQSAFIFDCRYLFIYISFNLFMHTYIYLLLIICLSRVPLFVWWSVHWRLHSTTHRPNPLSPSFSPSLSLSGVVGGVSRVRMLSGCLGFSLSFLKATVDRDACCVSVQLKGVCVSREDRGEEGRRCWSVDVD